MLVFSKLLLTNQDDFSLLEHSESLLYISPDVQDTLPIDTDTMLNLITKHNSIIIISHH